MYRRLELAKELLAEDGVIFVSIDDNEVFHLGLLMGQVFGAANFITNVIWQKVFSPKGTAQHFSDDHEYMVCYALNKDFWRPNTMPRSAAHDKAFKNPDNDHADHGRQGTYLHATITAKEHIQSPARRGASLLGHRRATTGALPKRSF